MQETNKPEPAKQEPSRQEPSRQEPPVRGRVVEEYQLRMKEAAANKAQAQAQAGWQPPRGPSLPAAVGGGGVCASSLYLPCSLDQTSGKERLRTGVCVVAAVLHSLPPSLPLSLCVGVCGETGGHQASELPGAQENSAATGPACGSGGEGQENGRRTGRTTYKRTVGLICIEAVPITQQQWRDKPHLHRPDVRSEQEKQPVKVPEKAADVKAPEKTADIKTLDKAADVKAPETKDLKPVCLVFCPLFLAECGVVWCCREEEEEEEGSIASSGWSQRGRQS